MSEYEVKLPIAGHLTFYVEAESEKEAIEKANDMPSQEGELDWQQVGSFNQGNVCYCPQPWSDKAKLV